VTAPRDPYDDLPYTDHAYAESHPDRLAVVARLSGWEAPEPATGRVLELGCGRGGNLLPMAAGLPGSQLVGVDRSRRQIDEARRIAAVAGLTNVRFVDAGFESLGDTGGPFDFVVCQGVCSWIPPASRRQLLEVVARTLASTGVAYVSFNVLPGWYDRLAARDWLRFAGRDDARASLRWLREHVSPELADYRRRLDAVERRLGETDRAYQVHEYLSDEHHPQLVSELLSEAADAGLCYLGDAIPGEVALELLPEAVGDRASKRAPAAAQQLVDFVRCTAFRRALLVRADTAAARGWRWPSKLKQETIDDLRVASRLRPASGADGGARERFDAGDVSVEIVDPAARAALRQLATAAPRSIPFRELARGAGDAAALRAELLDLWLATGAIDLHVHEPALGDGASARPLACPVARWHASHGGPLTNRWHQEVRLAEPVALQVLARLDGSRTADGCAREIGCAPDVARAAIAALGASALLVG
jgi:SAM-dependent methyltransferase